MRKTLIEWTDWTWNPLTGCFSRCSYCYNLRPGSLLGRFGSVYMENGKTCSETFWRRRETGKIHVASKGERIPYGFDPTFYPHRLEDPLKKRRPSKIFVCDCGDLFGNWVPDEWIEEVLKVVKKCPQHTFQFLTKNPKRYLCFEPLPDNSWAGTTVTCDRDHRRALIMKKVRAPIRFLSIEPLLGEVTFPFDDIQWIIVGAQTGRNPVRPKKEWIEKILSNSKKQSIPVFLKNNLRPHYPSSIQQFPR